MDKNVFLLADDDRDDRELFCEALESIGADRICYTVANGRQVLNTLEGWDIQPQLIFLDVNMPVMDGWQCLEKLKEEERYKAIPVIIISTSSHQREIDIAKRLGAFCYLIKPHDFTMLTQVIRTIVTNPGLQLAKAIELADINSVPYIHVL